MTLPALLLALVTVDGMLAGSSGPSPLAAIPLKIGDGYRLQVTARINGTEFACSVDSAGGDRIYLDKARALAASIQPTSEGRSSGPQSASMAADARAKVALEIGGFKLADQELVMQNRPYAAYACVIGMAVFKQYVVELSYDAAALRLWRSSDYEYSGPGHAVPLEMDDGNPFVTVVLRFPKGDPVTARLAVDTGGGPPAGFLTKSFVEKHDVMNRLSRTVPYLLAGTVGDKPRFLAARLEKLTLGDVELPRPVFFLFQTAGFGGATEPDGMLSPDFLRRFKLVFDYPRGKLILEPGPHFSDEMPFDASGALIYREGQNPYSVLKIIEGSPAAEAGLKEGDTVLELDGRPAGQVPVSEMFEALQADGRECSLRVKRGDEVLTVKMKLRRLI